MFGQYRTFLVGSFLAVLAVTLALAYFSWQGAQIAKLEFERTRVAHEVLEGLLRIRVHANRIDNHIALAVIEGRSDSKPVAELRGEIDREINALRGRIADEVMMLKIHADRQEELEELERLTKIERAIDGLVRTFDEISRLAATGQATEARRRFSEFISQGYAGGGLGGDFRTAMREAIEDEEKDIAGSHARSVEALQQSSRATLIAALLGILLVGTALFALLKRLQLPLARLSESAAAVTRGDLTTRVAVAGNDEFARVASAFNRMMDEVQAQRASLQSQHTVLETMVTERTSALSAANAALRKSDDARRRFLADISHELRTPLTAIRGEGEVSLRGRDKPVDEYKQTLGRVVQLSEHTARLVDDLLFIARADAAELRMHKQTVSLGELARRTCADARLIGHDKGISIEFSQTAEHAVVHGDPDRLRQMMLILLDNAARYGDAHSAITVGLDSSNSGVALTVSNRGPGIPENEIENVFERFYRGAVAATRNREGLGLGLPMAKAIVEAHGGAIDLQSRAGDGVTVTVHLPATRQIQGPGLSGNRAA